MAFTKKELELIQQCFVPLSLVGLHPGYCPSQIGLSTSNCDDFDLNGGACEDCLHLSLQKEMHLSKKSYRVDVDLALDCFKALSFMGIDFSMCPEEANYALKNKNKPSCAGISCMQCWIASTQEALEEM